MGVENIPDRFPGQTIQFSWVNLIRDVLIGAFVPRGLNGNPRSNYSRLGTKSFPWKEMHVQLADFGLGDVYHFHDYAGNIPIPQGWMLCDGSLVNESNYDAQHAAGDWDRYIVSSVLTGLYLPDTNLAYVKGKTGTLQAGTAPITTVGSSTANLAHTHGSPKTTTVEDVAAVEVSQSSNALYFAPDDHTHSLTITSDLSSAQDIRPSTNLVKMVMRII